MVAGFDRHPQLSCFLKDIVFNRTRISLAVSQGYGLFFHVGVQDRLQEEKDHARYKEVPEDRNERFVLTVRVGLVQLFFACLKSFLETVCQ